MKENLILMISMAILSLGLTINGWAQTKYQDGIYQAKDLMVNVEVTIENGRIAEINILKHRGGGEKYEEMIRPLIEKMIEKQSTDVDAVTGATVSSKALKNTVTEALQKAQTIP